MAQRRSPSPSLLLAPLLFLMACSSVTVEEPALSDSLLVEVLIDLHLAKTLQAYEEGLASTLQDSILAQHGLDETQFQAAMAYYTHNSEAYLALYTDVLNRLNEERVDLLDIPSPPADTTESREE